jgi:hypothetical protein
MRVTHLGRRGGGANCLVRRTPVMNGPERLGTK